MRKSAVFVVLFLLLSWSCNKNKSPQYNDEILKSYISAYTSGVVSGSAPIIIQLSRDVVPADMSGQEADKNLLKFEPARSGTAVWIDSKTLKFTPAESAAPRTGYKAVFNIGSLIKELPANAGNFYFDYRIKEQGVRMVVEPAVFSETDKKFTVSGTVELNDLAPIELVKKCISYSYPAGKASILWTDSGTEPKSVYHFTLNGLDVPSNDQNLELTLNGKPVGASEMKTEKVIIPSAKGFRYIASYVQNLPDQVVKLYFNTPVNLRQDLEGLVRMNQDAGQILDAESNVIYLYPSVRLSGAYKITVDRSLSNQSGTQLSNSLEIDVNFEDLQPAVVVANKNMILPDEGKLLLPFQAVSLNAVDVEIFKIYNSNILHYLQSESRYDINLEQVGKIIAQKKIVLDDSGNPANTQKFKKYSIDLSNIIKPEPDAFYQVRIGFRPEYSTYTCSEQLPSSSSSTYKPGSWGSSAEFKDPDFTSIMNYYDGYFGFGDDDTWEDRDNPCKAMYYNSDRFSSVTVYSSNIGLIAKSGKAGEVMVLATDLNTAMPLEGVDISFYDYQLQLLKTARTNNEGIALTTGFRIKPFAVVAQKDSRKGYLRLMDNESLNISQFDVVGEDVQRGVKAFLYGERGVWRPGDSLFLNFMMQTNNSADFPKNVPVNFELLDSRGVMQHSSVLTQNFNRLYPVYIATRADAVTGNWKAVFKAGGAVFNFPVKIETIKPNRMRMHLDFGKQELGVNDEPVSLTLSANWLYGAPARNLNTTVDLSMWRSDEKFKKFPDFEINNIREQSYFTPRSWFKGKLNDEGKVLIRERILPEGSTATGPMVLNFKTKVFEEGGEENVDNTNVKYHPFSRYCGVSVRKNSYGATTFGINQDVPVTVASITTNGEPVSQTPLLAEIFKLDWSWWWDEDESNSYSYYKSEMQNPVRKYELRTNAQGRASLTFKSADWGRFYVRVTDPVSGHTSGEYFYCGYPESDDDNNAVRAASIIPVLSNKENFEVGDEIRLKIDCPDKARVLISLENGSKVVKSFWRDAVKGENEFKFEATSDLAPNVYANVSIIQKFGQNVNDMPVRMYGIIPLKVEDKSTRLKPVIAMADELKPATSGSITVSEASGKAMAYTIDIVDEGLLDLTHFATPDPWKKFFAREALGVKTWDLFDRLAGTYTESGSQILSIGGDAGKKANPDKQRAIRFKPMVIHLGPFMLEKGKKATHHFKVPNYIGSVRAMVVATNDAAYGNAEKTIPVRSPVMVLASFPRVVGVGESIKVPVNVFTTNTRIKNVSVNLSDKAGILQAKTGAQSVSFSKVDEKVVYFDLTAGNREGIAKILINAKGNGESAFQEIEVEVRNPNPVQTSSVSGVVNPKKSAELKLSSFGAKTADKATLEVSRLLPFNLTKSMQYLISYPHGCLEQVISSAFPQLFVGNIIQLSAKQRTDAEKNVKAALARLKNFANADGSFNYWPGGNYSNNWANIYAGHFMIEARNAGYNIPNNLFENWIRNQRKMSSTWSVKQFETGLYEGTAALQQAYRLYVLALNRTADKGAMNRLREVSQLDYTGRSLLAAAYALDGKTDIAKNLLTKFASSVRDYDYAGYTFGSPLRDESFYLEAYQLSGLTQQADDLAVKMCKSLTGQNYGYSTQTLAFSISALSKYFGKNAKTGREMQFSYTLDGNKQITIKTKDPVIYIDLPTAQLTSGKLKLSNLGEGTIYTSVTTSGKPTVGNELNDAKNLDLDISFLDINGKVIDPQKLERGKEFIVSINVKNPGTMQWNYTNLALTQVFPSGWEITNPRMSSVQFARNTGSIDYQDFRDDRVLSYFSLDRSAVKKIQIQLTAAYPGKYYLPGSQCEAMYDNQVYSHKKGMWVTVL